MDINELIDAVVAAAGDITCVYEWATGGEWAQKRLDETKAALKSEFIRLTTAEVKRLTQLIAWKDDALDSYAEFYGEAAVRCGLPKDVNPSAETDQLILSRIII